MNLHTSSGTIENLRLVEAQQNIVFGPHMQEAAGISALVFAAAGMGGSTTARNTFDLVVSVYVKGDVGSKEVWGGNVVAVEFGL